jgi:hypothetical protein
VLSLIARLRDIRDDVLSFFTGFRMSKPKMQVIRTLSSSDGKAFKALVQMLRNSRSLPFLSYYRLSTPEQYSMYQPAWGKGRKP